MKLTAWRDKDRMRQGNLADDGLLDPAFASDSRRCWRKGWSFSWLIPKINRGVHLAGL